MLVLNLIRAADGALKARSIELSNDAFHTRVNLKGGPSVFRVFDDMFLIHLERLIARAGSSRMLMAADFLLELEHLVIRGCRVMVAGARNGIDHIMVRFKAFAGRVNAIFHPDYTLPQLRDEIEDDMSTQALESVLMPLFNFSAHIDAVLADDTLSWKERDLLANVKREIAKLEYSSDLLGYRMSSKAIARVSGGLDRSSALGSQDLPQLVSEPPN
jgi:hypothetical protein